jgi:hypothetical protein
MKLQLMDMGRVSKKTQGFTYFVQFELGAPPHNRNYYCCSRPFQ